MKNENKNIDRLFQEKFKDFEAVPNEDIWKKIKARKDNGRKKRAIVPFWFRIAGAAAVIALLFTIGSIFLSPDDAHEQIITNTNHNKGLEKDKKQFQGEHEGLPTTPPVVEVLKAEDLDAMNTSDKNNTRNNKESINSVTADTPKKILQ